MAALDSGKVRLTRGKVKSGDRAIDQEGQDRVTGLETGKVKIE